MVSISIIIPVYNEEATILLALNKISSLKKTIQIEVIVVNDGSSDNSQKLLEANENFYDKLINLKHNQGKGRAVIEGLKNATKDYVFFQDADLEYNPQELTKFVKFVDQYQADLVMGSRFTASDRSVLFFWHMLGNKFITFFFNFLNNSTFTDIYCCHCLFKKENLPFNKLKIYGWGQQAEILTYLTKNSKKIFETSVNYIGRDYSEGKKIRYHHVFGVLYVILSTKIKLLFFQK